MNSSTILVHPRVLASITSVLRFHGLRKQDELRDGIAETQTRFLEWGKTHELPTEPEAAAKVCATIAINACISGRRKKDVRRRRDGGLCEDPDEHATVEEDKGSGEDPVDVGRKLGVFLGQVDQGEMPEHARQVAVGMAEGKTRQEIAAELGVSENVVQYTAAQVRKRFRARLAALGLLTMATAVMIAMLLVPLGGVAEREPVQPVHPSRHAVVVHRSQAELPESGPSLDELREMSAKPR